MTTVAVSGVEERSFSTISWGAVIAGGIAAAAIGLLLTAFGVGVGFSVVSPWSDQGISASTFHIGSGLFLIVVAMLSSTVGGYLAGRLRARWTGVHADEVYFRDSAHGFLAWAFALLLSAATLGAVTTHLLGSASTGLIPATGAAAPAGATNLSDGYVDTLLRTDPTAATPASTAATPAGDTTTPSPTTASPMTARPAGDMSATRAELGRLLIPAMRKGGDLTPADRTYIAKVVAARTGIPQAEADKRVSDVITQAKNAADEARKSAAKFAFWIAASMLAGALAAALAAIEGGVLRDSKWYAPGWNYRRARSPEYVA